MYTRTSSIEPLEARIAPASVFVFTDVDGDHVTISSSKGDLSAAGVVNLTNAAAATVGKGHELQALNLDLTFASAVITITAKPSTDLTATTAHPIVQGDGFTNVGLINAPIIDLSSVTVHGDLGKILVGDADTKKPALGSLVVQSMGKYGTSTQFGATPDLVSRFENGVVSITVNGDVTGAFLHATATGAATTAKIGSVTIKGSLVGGTGATADDTGEVLAADGIGMVKILGNIVGGSGKQSGRVGTDGGGTLGSVIVGGTIYGGSNDSSGAIESGATIGSVKILGDIIGGSGKQSGRVATNAGGGTIKSVTVGGTIFGGSNDNSGIIDSAAGIGSVAVKGDLIGGSKFRAGLIHAKTTIGSTSIGGSVIGGTFGETGGIESDGDLGTVKIVGDLRGINFSNASSLKHTGFVLALGRIGGVSVGGSIVSGQESGGGTLSFSGAIQAGKDLAQLSVVGAVEGNSATPVVISGVGQPAKTKTDLAITKGISVGGNVQDALIEGGYDTTGAAVNGDAQLGAIKIGGDLIATDIVAGIKSTDAFFGNFGDSVIATGNTASILATIASITVGGQIVGTVDPTPGATSVDSFGIEAQLIGSIKTGGVSLALKPGPGNDDIKLSQTTLHDVHVKEFTGT